MVMIGKPNEIQLTRVYDAPVSVVWDAWVDPKQAAQWWGPRGFTLTTHSKDFRVGGKWVYTMHGPDGTDYPNTTVFLEIEKHKKMVYDHGGTENSPPMFRVTVFFTEIDGKTKMEMSMALPTAEAAANTRKFIKKASGDSCWDRFAEYLGETRNKEHFFVINRSFGVGIETLFEMWTDPKHIKAWLPPTGFNMEYINVDIKTGGSSFYKMSNGPMTMYGRAKYIEITRPNRIVYSQVFCDEKGNVSRHPMAPTFPETLLTTIELTEEGPDQTRVTVKMQPHGAFSAEELAVFVKARGGMTGGWTGSFDKLEEYLVKA
jgi:uncharacterized protein YndB with AHSA1/START domain